MIYLNIFSATRFHSSNRELGTQWAPLRNSKWTHAKGGLTRKVQWLRQELYLERRRRWHRGNDRGGSSGGGAGWVWLHGDGADHVLHCVDFAIFKHFRSGSRLKHGILGPNGRDGHCKRSKRETGASLPSLKRPITVLTFLKTKFGSHGLLPANFAFSVQVRRCYPRRRERRWQVPPPRPRWSFKRNHVGMDVGSQEITMRGKSRVRFLHHFPVSFSYTGAMRSNSGLKNLILNLTLDVLQSKKGPCSWENRLWEQRLEAPRGE